MKINKVNLDQFKQEVAKEIGVSNYDSCDKGSLTARQNGLVGGEMVKRMIASYEKNL